MSLARALKYAAEGYAVLAVYRIVDGRCSCGWAECKSPGKHPFNSRNGVYSASSDPDVVRTRFAPDHDANVALVIGEGPLADARVLDIDPKNGGDVRLAELEAKHGALPRTPVERSGSGGRHYVLGPFPGAGYRTKLLDIKSGIELLGRGRYFVADDSNHISGGRYEWLVPLSEPIAPAPAWLMDLATPRAYEPPSPLRRPLSVGNVMKRASAYLAECDVAISGQGGHDATFIAAMKLVRGFGLNVEQAFWLMAHEYNPRCKPPWSERDLRRKVVQAIEHGRMDRGALLLAERAR